MRSSAAIHDQRGAGLVDRFDGGHRSHASTILRLDKRGGFAGLTRRDDVAAAAIFAAGTHARQPAAAKLNIISM